MNVALAKHMPEGFIAKAPERPQADEQISCALISTMILPPIVTTKCVKAALAIKTKQICAKREGLDQRFAKDFINRLSRTRAVTRSGRRERRALDGVSNFRHLIGEQFYGRRNLLRGGGKTAQLHIRQLMRARGRAGVQNRRCCTH